MKNLKNELFKEKNYSKKIAIFNFYKVTLMFTFESKMYRNYRYHIYRHSIKRYRNELSM